MRHSGPLCRYLKLNNSPKDNILLVANQTSTETVNCQNSETNATVNINSLK